MLEIPDLQDAIMLSKVKMKNNLTVGDQKRAGFRTPVVVFLRCIKLSLPFAFKNLRETRGEAVLSNCE